ncbi:FKBP-type peptidyl-prolyl cis-trans isomerase [Phytoactinopolyspora endophytica]|uniref:FKBP-type peptidyl-prolyl cis-trans isomerase n=1 Tax=Phytoactinopolyspora endophytica TaxID=1642495 RepID=UPI0013EC3C74|nr:FKBP-type peptidyl-prolyl cis-trans isomerase [Phytoactinopolyspora endophytica]
MRTTRLLIAPLVAAGLILAACGDDEDSTSSSDVEVSGEFGETPTVEVPGGEPPEELEVDVLSEGDDGREVGETDFVVADYHGQTWEPRAPEETEQSEEQPGEEPAETESSDDGAEEGGTEDSETEDSEEESDEGGEEAPYVFDSSFERGQVAAFSLDAVIPGWKDGLAGQQVGSRVLLTIPADQAYGGQEGHDLEEDTLLFVVDIVDSIDPEASATGEPVEDLPEDMPVVEGSESGEPTVDFSNAPEEPEESDTTVLARGEGEEIGEGAMIAAQMLEAPYPDGEGAQGTWGTGTGPGQLIPIEGFQTLPGWEDVADGLTVGSRLVTRLTSEDASEGAEEGQDIPAIALVIDIVGSY